MTKVEKVLAGRETLTPREQRSLIKAAAILNGEIDRINRSLHNEELSQFFPVYRARRGEYVTKERRIIQALLGRGTRTR